MIVHFRFWCIHWGWSWKTWVMGSWRTVITRLLLRLITGKENVERCDEKWWRWNGNKFSFLLSILNNRSWEIAIKIDEIILNIGFFFQFIDWQLFYSIKGTYVNHSWNFYQSHNRNRICKKSHKILSMEIFNQFVLNFNCLLLTQKVRYANDKVTKSFKLDFYWQHSFKKIQAPINDEKCCAASIFATIFWICLPFKGQTHPQKNSTGFLLLTLKWVFMSSLMFLYSVIMKMFRQRKQFSRLSPSIEVHFLRRRKKYFRLQLRFHWVSNFWKKLIIDSFSSIPSPSPPWSA